jgi:hypothetical protein
MNKKIKISKLTIQLEDRVRVRKPQINFLRICLEHKNKNHKKSIRKYNSNNNNNSQHNR